MNGTVPGTVHTDLLTNGKIADPFYRMNEEDVQWVDSQQWVYRREFEVDENFLKEKRIELVAEGLDTYAYIRINNTKVGTTADMFVEHRFECEKISAERKKSYRDPFRFSGSAVEGDWKKNMVRLPPVMSLIGSMFGRRSTRSAGTGVPAGDIGHLARHQAGSPCAGSIAVAICEGHFPDEKRSGC